MKLIWKTKTFDKLTINELYDLLRLPEQVFIIEQTSIYPDIDNKDQKAIHLLAEIDGKLNFKTPKKLFYDKCHV